MSRKLRFVIACEVIDNLRLMKPHGMVPYTLYKHYGYDSEVLAYNQGEYPFLDNEVKGLKIRFLKPFPTRKSILPYLFYFARHARNIDVLMVYNVKKRPIYYGLMYKFFNPTGFLHVRADTSEPKIGFYVEHAFFLYKWYMQFLGRRFLNKCNTISVETSYIFEHYHPVDRSKLIKIPCGFDPDIAAKVGVPVRSFAEKENIVLHVARIGAWNKFSEHILDTLARIDVPDDWQFIFVGSQTAAFKEYAKQFMTDHPDKAHRVQLVEHTENKADLYDYYSRAKIFCLPSRREPFGNVLVEAQYYANVIVGSSHIPSVQDLTDQGKSGLMFDVNSPSEMGEQLLKLMQDQELLAEMSAAARSYCENNLIWKDIVAPLHNRIQHYYQPATIEHVHE